MASLMGATDAMLKSAEVRICGRHGIGAGWLTVVIEGQVAAVQMALSVGAGEANRYGELIMSKVVPRPEVMAVDAMPHGGGLGPGEIGPKALGVLETQGLTPLVVGSDQMLKSANVALGGWAFVGGALCHAVVFGDVAAVQTAVEVGRGAAQRMGGVYATLVLPQPIGGLGPLLPPVPAAEPRATGALGLLETIGYATIIGGGDAMLKAADVQVERLIIGSGGRIAALATGHLDDVEAAIGAGAQAAGDIGEVDASAVVSRPDPELLACFAGVVAGPRQGTARQAMGLIETRSTVALVRAVDLMLKSAAVEYEGSFKVGYYLTASIVRGDIGAVRVAIDAGRQEAVKHGELVSAYVIPQLYAGLENCLPHA
jgi:microcompartment protein CcmL/EutN